MSLDEARARRAYRLLLLSFPVEHRERHGEEMEDAFLALLRLESERAGRWARARCWVGAALDAATRGGAAHLRGTGSRHEGGREMMGTFLADLKFALRSLRRRPVFAATAILTIALGIGANAAVFTIVNGFMLRPLPYEDPDALVAIWAEMPARGWSRTDVNPADAWDWREHAASLEDVVVHDGDGWNLTGDDRPELVSGIRATPNLLSVLGRSPALGRDFAPDELGPGRDGVAILTDGFWERRFARDPSVVGSTLQLDGEPVVVVGVMPPDFAFLDERPDLLRPLHFDPGTSARGSHFANAFARLADGATAARAQEELVVVARRLEAEHPENEGWTVSVVPLHTELAGSTAIGASVVLTGAAGFVLLMACVNVANLLLARGGGRTREVAVRAALGAGRRRLAGQLLTESLALAGAGGLLGLAIGRWGYRMIAAALPSNVPPVFRFEMDATVFVYTGIVTVGAALLFGLVPAMRVSGTADHLRSGSRGGRSRGASRFGGALVVTQTALSVVLLVVGVLLMKSIVGMRTQDFGFDPAQVLTARLSPPEAQYQSDEEVRAFWADVLARVEALPGVAAAGATQSHPLMGSNWAGTVRIAGDAADGEDADRSVRRTYASAQLFDALGFRMASGRSFTRGDADGAPAAIVNEAFVDRYLGTARDPLSTTLLVGQAELQVIGVVRNVVERGVDDPPEPALYLPIEPLSLRARSLVVRTAGPPEELVEAVQTAVWSVDADVPLYGIETMDALVERRVGGFAVIGQLMAVFALLSLVLGAVGIYGVTSYAAAQRTGEIGVRLAMGARRHDVVRMLLGQGARRAAFGLVLGLLLALAVSRVIASVLVGVSPRDPTTYAGVTFVLTAVSLLGVYLPARKAAGTDPVRALTAE